jgi:RNA polymerase-binding transcription factor DksA
MMMDDPTRALRLRRINAKGLEIANKLAELLAGQDVRLSDFELTGGEPGETKEQRLRRFLSSINAARTRLLGHSDAAPYGECLACGVELPAGALDEMPWVERCPPCAASDAADR